MLPLGERGVTLVVEGADPQTDRIAGTGQPALLAPSPTRMTTVTSMDASRSCAPMGTLLPRAGEDEADPTGTGRLDPPEILTDRSVQGGRLQLVGPVGPPTRDAEGGRGEQQELALASDREPIMEGLAADAEGGANDGNHAHAACMVACTYGVTDDTSMEMEGVLAGGLDEGRL